MPTYEITAPDGNTYEVTAPEGASEQEILDYAKSNYQSTQEKQYSPLQSGIVGTAQGLSFGTADEMAAATKAGLSALGGGDFGEVYRQTIEQQQPAILQAQRDNPWAYRIGEIGGAIGTGIGTAGQALKVLPRALQGGGVGGTIARGLGIGAGEGAIYGAGSSYGGIEERAQGARAGAALGAVGGALGVAGAPLARKALNAPISLAQRAKSLVTRKPQGQPVGSLRQIAQQAEGAVSTQYSPRAERAFSQVKKAIERDFPDNSDQVLQAWARGDEALMETYGGKLKELGQGAAQFEGGRTQAERFFSQKIQQAPDIIEQSIKKNITSDANYYATVDDILEKGRTRAKPLYEKAYDSKLKDTAVLNLPEVQDALERAYKIYPSKLQNAAPDSIQALDYAKRVLDADIIKARGITSPDPAFVADRTAIKNTLLQAMDEASPDYAKARKSAGDYLSLTNAMDEGLKFMRQDKELLKKQFSKMNDQERIAFKSGIGKAIRDVLDATNENANFYNRIFGKQSQKDKLRAVLSPEEYKNFAEDAKAMDRLFQARNKILSGSNTSEKQVARQAIEESASALELTATGGASLPKNILERIVRRVKTGLSDDMARDVANILYETRPSEKLRLIEKLGGSASRRLPKAEIEDAKSAIFIMEQQIEQFKKQSAQAAGAGAAAMGAMQE